MSNNTKGNGLTIRIAEEAGIPVVTCYGKWFTFKTSDGVRFEMSRAQFERLIEGYRKGVEFEEYVASLADATLGQLGDADLEEYLEPTI